MKIPITDKFLWDIYNFLEPIHSNVDIILIPRTPYKWAQRVFQEKNPVFEKYRKEMHNQAFNKLMYHLKKNNWIEVENLKGKKAILLTKRGMHRVIKNRFKFESTKLNKRSDGKWIMIIFDIPKSHNKSRNLLRSILQNLGYKLFQHSVWVTPYNVAEKTEKLLQMYSLDNYVRIFLIEKL